MRILVVHEVSYLKKFVYEFQILSEMLSVIGHDVTVVDFDDTWFDDSSRPLLDLSSRRFESVNRVYRNSTVTLRHPGVIRAPIVSRLSGAVTCSIEVWNSLRESNFDAVLLYGVPTVGIQVLLATSFRNIPVFFRSIDISHKLVPSSILSVPTRIIEGLIYRHVAGVSALTPRMKKYVASYGVPVSMIDVLPGGVDTEMFSCGNRNDNLLARWGIGSSDRVILFMGTIYRFSGLFQVIREFPKLLKDWPEARLLIVGRGEDEIRLKSLTREAGLTGKVVFAGAVDYALLPDLIRSSSICLNPFEINELTQDILPTKLFQYLACGKPVVATRLPGMIPFLTGEREGVVYADLADFVAVISDLLADGGKCQELGSSGRATMASQYDWRSIAERLLTWIESKRV